MKSSTFNFTSKIMQKICMITAPNSNVTIRSSSIQITIFFHKLTLKTDSTFDLFFKTKVLNLKKE